MRPLNIDIFDLNIIVEIMESQKVVNKDSFFKVFTTRMVDLIKFLLKKKKSAEILNTDILLYAPTNNNKRAFKTVCENLIGINYFQLTNNNGYQFEKAIYKSLPYIGKLLLTYAKSTSQQRKQIRSSFTSYLLVYGKYLSALEIFKIYNPKILVLANDHSTVNRCLLKVATDRGIKTIYIQHASVTFEFPKLSFDYCFLDGAESFEKYGSISKKGSKVFLSGSSRYDNFYNNNISNKGHKIGIAVNEFDDFEVVKNLCINLLDDFAFPIIVRPHPSMKEWHKEWFVNNNIEFSNASIVSPNDFLNNIFIQISNVSGIHLDACILKVPTVQYRLSTGVVNDQYKYVSNGLIKQANSLSELYNFISNPDLLQPEKRIVQYYMASMSKHIEGNVGAFIADYIKAILDNDLKKQSSLETKSDIEVFCF